jgi:hypothetical protein
MFQPHEADDTFRIFSNKWDSFVKVRDKAGKETLDKDGRNK